MPNMAREGNVQSKEHNLAGGGLLFAMGIATPSRGWYSGGLRIVTGGPMGPLRRESLGKNHAAGGGVGSGGGSSASENCGAFRA
jgi:hypothetical protein